MKGPEGEKQDKGKERDPLEVASILRQAMVAEVRSTRCHQRPYVLRVFDASEQAANIVVPV